jgi:hypothetical protein
MEGIHPAAIVSKVAPITDIRASFIVIWDANSSDRIDYMDEVKEKVRMPARIRPVRLPIIPINICFHVNSIKIVFEDTPTARRIPISSRLDRTLI